MSMRKWAAALALVMMSAQAYAQDADAVEEAPAEEAADDSADETAEAEQPAPEALSEEPTWQGDSAMLEKDAAATAPAPAALAVAEPSARRFAVGGAQTLVGVRGVSGEFRAGKLMLEAIFGAVRYSPDQGPDVTRMAFAAGAFYRWKTPPRVSLLIGGRLALAYSGTGATAGGEEGGFGGDSSTDVHIEAPLRVEIALSDRLSVHGEAGPLLSLVEGSSYVAGGTVAAKTTRLSVTGGGLVAGFGFAWAL